MAAATDPKHWGFNGPPLGRQLAGITKLLERLIALQAESLVSVNADKRLARIERDVRKLAAMAAGKLSPEQQAKVDLIYAGTTKNTKAIVEAIDEDPSTPLPPG